MCTWAWLGCHGDIRDPAYNSTTSTSLALAIPTLLVPPSTPDTPHSFCMIAQTSDSLTESYPGLGTGSSSQANVVDHPHLTRDDIGLEGLGYRPELKRNFSKLETFGVAFSIMYASTTYTHDLPCRTLTWQGRHPVHCIDHLVQPGAFVDQKKWRRRQHLGPRRHWLTASQPYGGPVGMIWGWVLSSFLISFIGFAMVRHPRAQVVEDEIGQCIARCR